MGAPEPPVATKVVIHEEKSVEKNYRPIEDDLAEQASPEVEEAPADSSEDPATPEDFEEEGMGIAPKE